MITEKLAFSSLEKPPFAERFSAETCATSLEGEGQNIYHDRSWIIVHSSCSCTIASDFGALSLANLRHRRFLACPYRQVAIIEFTRCNHVRQYHTPNNETLSDERRSFFRQRNRSEVESELEEEHDAVAKRAVITLHTSGSLVATYRFEMP